jgi:RNA polymerase subunit RPABC4/transcription elongation factor Spt4
MSLIKCKACGTQISKKAKSCPNCGEPAPKKTSFVTWGVLIIIVFAVIGSLNSNNTPKTKAEPQLTQAQKADIEKEAKERALRSLEIELTVKAERSVSNLMKDPDSTKFKNVFFNQTKKGGSVICGNYDSKNSFGAYSGFKRFISNGTTTFIEERDTNIAEIWVETCLKEKQP